VDKRSVQIAFIVGVLASLAASVFAGVISWFISQSWAAVAVVAAAWTALVVTISEIARRSYLDLRKKYEAIQLLERGLDSEEVKFVPRMSNAEAQDRIRSARKEIWSFQISGSEFTASSSETYETWLASPPDPDRTLLIAFANPENTELLKSIVRLSGLAEESTEDHEYEHLRVVISTSLNRYIDLRDKFGERVDVRVYDFSPPYSFHAIDPDDSTAGSGFVELYLPNLPSADRPCMLLPHDHPKYSLYRDQSLSWFEASRRAQRAGEATEDSAAQ
jgi:hypothetical protein